MFVIWLHIDKASEKKKNTCGFKNALKALEMKKW